MSAPGDIKSAMLDVAEWLRERSEETAYGMAQPSNPHDFFPDPECSTEAERKRHSEACKAWDRGDYVAPPPAWTEHRSTEAAKAYLSECIESHGAASGTIWPPNKDGTVVVHCHVDGWGVGTYTMRDAEAIRVADYLSRMAEHEGEGCNDSRDARFAAGAEAAAALVERVRCRTWTPKECAWQIREHLRSGHLARPGR